MVAAPRNCGAGAETKKKKKNCRKRKKASDNHQGSQIRSCDFGEEMDSIFVEND